MSNLLDEIDREIAELEAALRADPRHEKIKKLREVRTLYVGTSAGDDVSSAAAPQPPVRRVTTSPRRIDPVRQRILASVEDILTFIDQGPVKTADIYDLLVADGHVIGGQEPKSNLSAMLFNSGRFQSHGRKGWTLKPATTEVPLDSADEEEAV